VPTARAITSGRRCQSGTAAPPSIRSSLRFDRGQAVFPTGKLTTSRHRSTSSTFSR
jgi:hypothetical protein